MSLEEAKNIISEETYTHSRLIELLENVGKIRGNGHHIRQKIAANAENLLKERWIETPNKTIHRNKTID